MKTVTADLVQFPTSTTNIIRLATRKAQEQDRRYYIGKHGGRDIFMAYFDSGFILTVEDKLEGVVTLMQGHDGASIKYGAPASELEKKFLRIRADNGDRSRGMKQALEFYQSLIPATSAPKDFDRWMQDHGPKNDQPAPAPAKPTTPDKDVIKEAVKGWLDAIRNGDRKAKDDADKAIIDVMVQQGVMTPEEGDHADTEHNAEEHDLVHIFVSKGDDDTVIYEADLNGNTSKF